MKKFLKTISITLCIMALSTVMAFAADETNVKVEGINRFPAFMINEEPVYCAEMHNTIPHDNQEYHETLTEVDFSCCDKVFVAAYIMNDTSVEYRQVIQQIVWAKINNFDPEWSIKKMPGNAYEIYKQILSTIETINMDEFEVEYVSYKTNATSNDGTPYQMLIGAKVKEIPTPEIPIQEPPIPEEPVSEVPIQEIPVPDPPVSEEPVSEQVEEPTTENPLPDEQVQENTTVESVETESPRVLTETVEIPKTGDSFNFIFYLLLLVIASTIAIAIVKKNKK